MRLIILSMIMALAVGGFAISQAKEECKGDPAKMSPMKKRFCANKAKEDADKVKKKDESSTDKMKREYEKVREDYRKGRA